MATPRRKRETVQAHATGRSKTINSRPNVAFIRFGIIEPMLASQVVTATAIYLGDRGVRRCDCLHSSGRIPISSNGQTRNTRFVFGAHFFVVGWWIMTLALRENAFAAPVVKYQKERQQVRSLLAIATVGWLTNPPGRRPGQRVLRLPVSLECGLGDGGR